MLAFELVTLMKLLKHIVRADQIGLPFDLLIILALELASLDAVDE